MDPGSKRSRRGLRRTEGLAALVALLLGAAPSLAQDAIDADADAILRAMSDQLKTAAAFSVRYDGDQEIVDRQGQKLQYSASGTLTMARDAGFLVTRQGPFADVEVRFDGKVVSLVGKRLNVYGQIESPSPSIDEAVEEFRMSTGLDLAGADLLSSDPYAVLTENVVSGTHVGTAYLGGVECDHLAFRNDDVDWQIWVTTGAQRLPLKYVITTKWVTGAPQYSLRLSDWTIGAVDSTQFAYTPAAGARKIAEFHADAIGDFSLESGE